MTVNVSDLAENGPVRLSRPQLNLFDLDDPIVVTRDSGVWKLKRMDFDAGFLNDTVKCIGNWKYGPGGGDYSGWSFDVDGDQIQGPHPTDTPIVRDHENVSREKLTAAFVAWIESAEAERAEADERKAAAMAKKAGN